MPKRAGEPGATIHVIDGYYITQDPYQWIVYENNGKTDKNGEVIKEKTSYHTTLQNGIREVRKRYIKAGLKGKDLELREAIRLIGERDDEFDEKVKFLEDV